MSRYNCSNCTKDFDAVPQGDVIQCPNCLSLSCAPAKHDLGITKEELDQVKRAICYTLRRIREEWNIGYHMGAGTQAFELLTKAAATLTEKSSEEIEEVYAPCPKRKCDTQILREIKSAWQDYLCDSSYDASRTELIEKLHKIMKEAA